MDLNCLAILDGMFSDTNSRWLFWDRPEESLFGPFLDLIHPDDIKSTLQALENLSCATSVIDFRQQYRKNTGTFAYSGMPIFLIVVKN